MFLSVLPRLVRLVDPNAFSKSERLTGMTTLHLLVMKNDYEMMSKFMKTRLEWQCNIETGLKDAFGRNACDLAIELGH